MFDAKKARLQELKERFDRAFEARAPEAHDVGQEYLTEMVAFLDEFDHGPAANPVITRVDTTGTINRNEEYTEWVSQEHTRVRRLIRELR